MRTTSVAVVPLPHSMLDIPIYGSAPCGPACFDHTQIGGVPLREALATGDLFGFIAVGDSMSDAGILSGDYLVCNADTTPKRGRLVVVRSDHNEYMCKRWTGKSLQSERGGILEEIAPDRDWSLLGPVIQVMRDQREDEKRYRRMLKAEARVTMLEEMLRSRRGLL